MLRIALLAGLLSSFISLNISAQRIARISDEARPGLYSTSLLQTNDFPAVEKSYIVQFEGSPRLVRELQGNKSSAFEQAAPQVAFESDLTQIASSMQLQGRTLQINEVFTSVFNGALITAPTSALNEIRSLPYVKRIVEDGLMATADLPHSLFQHDERRGNERALLLENSEKQNREYRTARENGSVVVAVIDSGVDYTHPDLHGGYLGGYDYVNDDDDPMDDNGHGTHVAGILAGNGVAFKGTAPDVQYIALKVLDASGKGFDSAVIRAIEHAANPDGDPFTNDAVDIINLSISSLEVGMADHPVTLAVENAIAAGIVCVVAAGNRGEEGRASITAPGNASSAITVGAANQQEGVAPFSSQGPSGSIKAYSIPFFGLKPDILAPGVQIQSTWLNGQYEVRDGTSMASPYVAGIVARMIQQFPDWDPIMIKAHLMQQTRDLGESIWTQGAGMVDNTQSLSFVVSPACMDFGLVYSSQRDWDRTETLTVSNLGTSATTYEFKVRDTLPEGVQVSLSNTVMTIFPGESTDIELGLFVQPHLLAASPFPEGYVGYIDIVDASNTISVPFSLFKTESAHVRLSDSADRIMLQSHTAENEQIYIDANDVTSLFVPPDTYDMVVQFDDGQYTVVKEAIDLQDASLSEIQKAEAAYPVRIHPLDINQQLLDPLSFEMTIQKEGMNWALSTYTDLTQSNSNRNVYYSSVSDAFSVAFNVSAFSDTEDYYHIPFRIQDGIAAEVELENDPDVLKRFRYQYALPDGTDEVLFVPWVVHNALEVSSGNSEITELSHPGYVLTPPFEKSFYTASVQEDESNLRGFGHSIVQQTPSESQKWVEQRALLRSSPLFLRGDSAMIQLNNGLRLLEEGEDEGFELYPGSGEGYWAGVLDNSATRIRIKGPDGGGLFRGEWGEAFQSGGEWGLLKDGSIIDHDSLSYAPEVLNGDESFAVERTVEPGAYTLIIRNDAFLPEVGKRGHAVELNFKTDRADPDPPRIHALYGRQSGEGDEELVIDVTDVCNWCTPEAAREHVSVVQLWVKESLYGDWVEQPLVQHDSLFIASFRGAFTEQYYALRVRAEDAFANSLDYYTVDESTFSVSDPKAVGLENRSSIPTSISVTSIYPNPTPGPVRFTYALADPADVQIFVYDVLGRSVMHLEKHQSAGTHEHVLDFNSFANGLYTLQLKAGEHTEMRQVLKIR